MTTTGITTAAASRLAVGTRIRERRVELAAILPDFEALSFSRRLGITVGHLYHVETGRVGVSAALLERIASLLGLDAHRLLAANGQIAPSLEKALLSKPEVWKEIERGRAMKYDPAGVADVAAWPINHIDLMARKRYVLKEYDAMREKLFY